MADDGYHDDVVTVAALPLNTRDAPLKALHLGREAAWFISAFAGSSRIAGVVKIGDAPVSREVRLYARSNGWLVAVTRSAVDGTYEFANIDGRRQYLVVSLDDIPGAEYNAVVADQVTPV